MEKFGNHWRKPTLANFFEWIGERTAGDSTAEAYARSHRLHHRAIETMGDALDAQVLRIRGLHLILLERLHLDNVLVLHACMVVFTGDVFSD